MRIEYSRGQQFLGLDSLALDNLWQDPSMLRERLAMHVFRRLGLPAPRETHVRLFVGPARAALRSGHARECVDVRSLCAAAEDGWRREHRPGIGTGNDASPYLDVRKVITYIAVENFLAEVDGFLGGLGMANFYIYRFAASDSWQLIPWDRDLSFAVIDDMRPTHNVATNVLTRKIWAVRELRRLYLQTLLAVAASVDDWLEREVEREYAQIREAARQDPLKPSSNAEFEQAVDFLRRFARERGPVVRGFVAEIAPELTANSTPRIPPRGLAIQSRQR
jgi:hypothetical protein